MPGRLDIMDAIREGLDAIHFAPNVGFAEWTRARYRQTLRGRPKPISLLCVH